LVFDLDGTLIATDLLVETLLLFLKRNPLRILVVVGWMLAGRAHLKRKLADAVQPDYETLPLREDVVAYARTQAEAGRELYIATAADLILAQGFARRLPFFKGVIGSDGVANLKAGHKAVALSARFPNGFAYVGDARPDLKVWEAAQEAIFVGGSSSLHRQTERLMGRPVLWLRPPAVNAKTWIKALRLHQWAKNSLIFVPLVLGGALWSEHAWLSCLLGFLGMGTLATATYVLNDLLDLEDDRRHWTKRNRAFARGLISIPVAAAIIPLGLATGLTLGWLGGGVGMLLVLGVYLATTLAYSFGLKRAPILDVVILAGLFTLRLAAGVVCANVAWSNWLLVFSMFIFGSLSFAKRQTELVRLKAKGGERLAGRGYIVQDEPMILAFGVSLASAAVLVIVMYLMEDAFMAHFFGSPQALWTLPVVLALWLGRIWLLCGRGELHDDPVVFAIRDKISLALGAFLGLSVAAAAFL
jgi:4-hydroxybenzoate polyprenyltransferase